jgi:hypothetical protein
MSTSARGTYGTANNSGKGTSLGGGSGGNALQNVDTPVVINFTETSPSTYSNKAYSTGVLNYQRTGAFITIEGKANNLNSLAANDFFLTDRGAQSLEQHSSKYGRKLAITEIDQNGNITYGATNGTTYGLYHTSGTPVDKNADAAKSPYGTPANYVVLDKASPTVHSYNRLSSI